MLKTEKLKLVSEWDKTFPQSEKVDHKKVTFVNRYGITLAADLYKPKNASGKYPAIAVSGPFGAVKEQCSGLYAQTMAERGYLTIAFDPSFTGESGGYPRFMASPDINTEDFMAAVDFLSVREDVDPDKIGIIGICGWGGMALNAAALDTRIKATVASTMYDMTRVNANGYFDSEDSEEARYAKKSLYATLKTDIYQSGGMCDMLTDQNYATVEAALTAGTMPKDSRSIVIDYNVLKQNEDMGVGSTVDFYFGEGQPPVSVTVSGLFDSNKTPSGHGKLALDGVLFFAPEALFHELHPEIASFDYSWSIVNDPKKTDYVGAELKNIVASHSNIALDEINTVIEYEEMTNSFAFGSMEILSWLVFLFGVINLINTTLSNQIARKQENSILRSIGLTQKQLCKMNICEGLCYALFATLATLIVGLPASIFACRKMSIGAFAGNVVPYKFPVLEMGLFILVLFGMELILSVWTIRRQKKQSLIEQMRAME